MLGINKATKWGVYSLLFAFANLFAGLLGVLSLGYFWTSWPLMVCKNRAAHYTKRKPK